MAGIAKHQQTEELHPANEANSHEKYLCPHCDAPASHVRSHIRETPSGDSTRVSPHFRFYDCKHGMQTERSASAGNPSGGGSGESPLHRRRKVQAMNVLLDVFETERCETECYIGEKRCDAVVLLADPHEQYGKGFVVEYQHKNEQKDIEAVERHYASHNFTTLWLWEEQFTFSGLVPDVDLFGGRVFKPWPQVVPDCEEWSGTANRHRLRAMIGTGTTTRVDATLKMSFVLPTEREYWQQQPWQARFGFSAYNQYRMDDMNCMAWRYQGEVASTSETSGSDAQLPPEYTETKIYNQLNWESIESVGYPEVLKSPPCQKRRVPVTISQPAIDDLQLTEHTTIRNAQAMRIKQLGRIRGKIRAKPQITTRELATHFSWDHQTIEMRLRSLNRDGKISGSHSEGWIYTQETDE